MAWPTTSNPRTVTFTARMTAQEAAEIDQLVQATGASSRSEAVRNAVRAALAKVQKQASRKQKNAE